ncbi:MAG: MFS transporter [Ilumatobacter sp.]|jgi:MFS family permease|uniref:MFS transporter n=1 Tax=Ilumatobacter sp. TaxID=1967498 RepID=UPI00391DC419
MTSTTTTPAPPPDHGFTPGTARAALSYRSFRIVFIGLAISQIGTWMQNFLLPAYIQERTGRPALVGVSIFVQLGPLLFLSIPGGVLADKVSKQKLMLTMQIASAILTLGTAWLVWQDATVWAIFGVQLLIGTANALNAPAFQSSMPLLVHRQDLAGAISLNSAMINGTRVMGPVTAALLGVFGLSLAQIFLVNAFSYLTFIAALLLVPMPDVKAAVTARGWRQLGVGLKIARERLVLNRLLLGMFSFSAISLAYIGLFPSVAELNFGIDADSSRYRWLYAAWGAGAFAGALSVGTFLSRFHRRVLIVRGFTGFAVSLAVFAMLRDQVSPFFVGFALGFFYFMTATAITTSLQLNMRDGERASVMPLWFMVFGGTVPLGNLAGGVLFEAIGVRPVLLIGAGWALFLAWWLDLRRQPPEAFLSEADGGETP